MNTAFSMAPVLRAVYMAGRFALRDRLGSLSLPACKFPFRSAMKVSRNFFSVCEFQGGMGAGMLLRPALVTKRPSYSPRVSGRKTTAS